MPGVINADTFSFIIKTDVPRRYSRESTRDCLIRELAKVPLAFELALRLLIARRDRE